MQLPTSITSTPYTPPNSNSRPVSTPSNTSDEQAKSGTSLNSSSDSKPATVTEQPATQNFAPVEPASPSELSDQDLSARRGESESSSNPAISNYQQIAREGASNAQAQDPSLFRVDVYV